MEDRPSRVEQFYTAAERLQTDNSYEESGKPLAGDIMVQALKDRCDDEFIAMLYFWSTGFGNVDDRGCCYNEFHADKCDNDIIDMLFDRQDVELWKRVCATDFWTFEMYESHGLMDRYRKLPEGEFKREVAVFVLDHE